MMMANILFSSFGTLGEGGVVRPALTLLGLTSGPD
jgi:hypothetical protein